MKDQAELCPSIECDYLSPPLPVIPFSSDDIRSKHPYDYNSTKKFRVNICSVEAQLGNSLHAKNEQQIKANANKANDWASKLKKIARKFHGIAQQRLRNWNET